MDFTSLEPRDWRWRGMLVALLAGVLVVPAAAQTHPFDYEAPVTFSVMAAGVAAADELARDTWFEPALGLGASATYWAAPSFGLRLRALRTEPSIRTDDPVLAGTDPDVWLLTGGLIARGHYHLLGRETLPYLRAELGTKRYAFDDPYHALAAELGAGVEFRAGRFGLFAEAGHVFSELHRMGFWENQRDWVYAGGLSVHLGGDTGTPVLSSSGPRGGQGSGLEP